MAQAENAPGEAVGRARLLCGGAIVAFARLCRARWVSRWLDHGRALAVCTGPAPQTTDEEDDFEARLRKLKEAKGQTPLVRGLAGSAGGSPLEGWRCATDATLPPAPRAG